MKVVLSNTIYEQYLFLILKAVVYASAGDGFGVVICKNPHVLGKRFLEWIDPPFYGYQLDKHEDYVLVHDGSNESFLFSSNQRHLEARFADIVITLEGPVVGFNDQEID